ncbi:MAG TPA: hypothetical protein VGA06_01990 [Candidatus Paceibacterota bacterium]|jgi:hypothetical protein
MTNDTFAVLDLDDELVDAPFTLEDDGDGDDDEEDGEATGDESEEEPESI